MYTLEHVKKLYNADGLNSRDVNLMNNYLLAILNDNYEGDAYWFYASRYPGEKPSINLKDTIDFMNHISAYSIPIVRDSIVEPHIFNWYYDDGTAYNVSDVYDHLPRNYHYYFQIVNNCLYMKVSEIIASRFIAYLKKTEDVYCLPIRSFK